MRMLGDEPALKLEGRAGEQAALGAALEGARRGHGRIVVVSGEAGIGKSALLHSLAAQASSAGLKPIWGRAWEFADAPAYFPLWPCLAALGLRQEELGVQSPFAIWESVLAALSRAAQNEPCLWLLEDLHAADLQTLDLLTFLAQPLRVLPALVVVTTRPRDPRLSERGEQRLLRMARDGLDLRLSPLGAEGVGRLAQQLAGELSDATVQGLLELTSGNPLFVVECARSLKARGQHSLLGISPTIRQVVLERLQLLPEGTRELLESGSVLGREFSAALLGRMHEALPARVVDQLLPALRGGVALERAPGSFAFSHVLVQSAIYESLSAERRGKLHQRALLALQALPDGPEISLERARHALGAVTPETEHATLRQVLRAGRALEESGAFDRAHALYGRLREKLARGELSCELTGPQLLHMAGVAERGGKSAEGRNLSLSVLKRARADADPELLAHAALELGRGIRPGLVDQELVLALREALAQRKEDGSALSCRLLARLAAALQPATDPAMPVEMAKQAIAQARSLEDPAALLEVLDVAGSACVDFAPLELRLRISEELLARATEACDFVRTQRARARLAFERAELGGFDAFDLHVSQMLSEAEEAGIPQARVRPLLMASLSAANRGSARESAGLVAEARQLLSLTDDPALALSVRAHGLSRAWLLWLDDELERYELEMPRMVTGVPASELLLHSLRSMVRTRLGRHEAAREDLLAAWPLIDESGLHSLSPVLAEVAAFVGEVRICTHLRRVLAPLSGLEASGGHVSVSYEGPIDRLLGLLDAALGDLAGAEQKLRATLALAEKRGFSAWVALGRFELANLLASTGRAAQAERLWQGAAELAEACEMTGMVARIRERRAGGFAAPPASRSLPSGGMLTMQREGELFRLERGALSARIRASRGAELLARLIGAPDQEIHVLALASDEALATTESNAGEIVDRTALKQYRARLAELSELLAEAEARADLGRAEALRREQATLEREVAGALGLSGRSRQAGSTTERARVNAQRRLKDALERVSAVSPELGTWLGRSLRTGTYCSFRPSL